MNNEQKQKDKEQILSLVKAYADKYLSNINTVIPYVYPPRQDAGWAADSARRESAG